MIDESHDEPEKISTVSNGDALVVGIGASAGGLDAFRSFLYRMAPDSGMAFILVQHLAPDHKSMLTEILARESEMPVVQAEDGMAVEANRVYVIVPDATLIVKQRTLRISKPAPPRATRRPIDTFFLSLAADQGDNAVCIVMAGTGSDGSLGLKAVKEAGGLTLAQAEFDSTPKAGMPQSADETGLVDHVLPVEDMPAKLLQYRDHLRQVADRKDGDGIRTDAAEHLGAIRSLLRARVGHDFDKYKKNTLLRRIQRRMQVLQIEGADAYVDRLRQNDGEADLLFRDLLIGVTQFFRDRAAFEALAESGLPGILESKQPDDPVRIWVPGCSTGEEVYTIAMLLLEAMENRGARHHQVQIFGTDIDDQAIAFARAGRYAKTTGLSPERLARWFTEDGGVYRPVPQVREICIFSVHSVIKDPPFSRLDLISCRNVMIYMEGDLQDRMLRTFHFALNPDGLLLLGPSEGVVRHGRLFSTIDGAAHLFRRRIGDAVFLSLPLSPPPDRRAEPIATPPGGERIDRIARRLLSKYSPVYMVVDRQHHIMHFSGGEMGRYLEPMPGAPSSSLFDNLRRSLRSVVRAALDAAAETRLPIVHEDIVIEFEGVARKLSVIVEPLAEGTDVSLFVLAFREGGPAGTKSQEPGETVDSAQVRAAEDELRTLRTQLQSTINSLETTNEDLRSAVEEYQSVNEELQSSNEELATSKEEMQSINEELQTVNAEMHAKNNLLTSLNSDLKNLLDSTQIATIFLDANLRIKNFTPGMAELFHLRDTDRGRPLTEIVALLDYERLIPDVAKVLRDLSVVERPLVLRDGTAAFTMRIRPYRTVENVIDGVVITFVDVTQRNRAFEALKVSEGRFAAIVAQASVGVVQTDLDGRVILANAKFQDMVGRTAEELAGLRLVDIAHPEDRAKDRALFEELSAGRHAFEAEQRFLQPDGAVVWVHKSVSALLDGENRPTGVLAVVLEIGERKRSEAQTLLLLDELDHRVKNILSVVSAVVAQSLKAGADTPAAFAEAITSRVAAIARAHSVLRNGVPGEATLRALIDTELAPYRVAKREITVSGVDIALTPKAGLSFALVLHELTSNAAKYGALSTDGGRLAISLTVTEAPDRTLHLVWVEEGGPPIEGPPSRRGFGTTLIQRSLTHEWNASVQQDFLPSGMCCTIDLPLSADVGEVRRSPEHK